MNCQQINHYLLDYSEGNVSPPLRDAIEEHLSQCEYCRNNYKLTLIENEILREKIDIPELSENFTSRVIQAIVPSHAYSFRRQRKKPLAWVAACVALIALVGIHWPQISNAFIWIDSKNMACVGQETQAGPRLNAGQNGFNTGQLSGAKDSEIIVGSKLDYGNKDNTNKSSRIIYNDAATTNHIADRKEQKEVSRSAAKSWKNSTEDNKSSAAVKTPSSSASDSIPVPVDVPPEYQLVEVEKHPDEFVYQYQRKTDQARVAIIVKDSMDQMMYGLKTEESSVNPQQFALPEEDKQYLSMADTGPNENSPDMKAKEMAPQVPEERSIKVNKYKHFDITIRGNIDADELTRLALAVNFQSK